ncbi:hypothetical protein H0H93_010197 [Arthromyces matolae]|nr:hypothetical protein H0H93_010197 [Arthromyces matolae]
MSSFDKVVKLACKPKAAAPKSKYLDTIIAATWSDDGAIHDVCKALVPRLREPNTIVVFKALIVLHTMIRSGATDNVLGYLSNSDVLRLRNVSGGSWEGYAVPENLQHYASYLDSRIKAYRDLKHDAVRVQADTNRDMRNSASIEDDMVARGPKKGKGLFSKNGPPSPAASASTGPSRSRTIMGRKLRVMTVEKGLLRETKAVHRVIDALVECRFYLDNLEDELTITALQMLVKDLLILFQAGNEGVINVLEHYFEMSHVDATEALAIYRHFCKQTERVVEFLGVAKKLQNLLNVPIPNLKHAPVSLAGSLQEYLEDPAFEQNRIEYKASKEAADKGLRAPAKAKQADIPSKSPSAPAKQTQSTTGVSKNTSTPTPKSTTPSAVDFFAAIEEGQPTMFNPQTNSPNTAYFHTQSASNPFTQMQMTGQPFMHAQPTGFIQPQTTSIPSNPFSLQPQQTGHPSFASFLPQSQSQPSGFALNQQHQATGLNPSQSTNVASLRPQPTGFLQPQATGVNPFRQSMLFPQSAGMQLFAAAGTMGQPYQNAFPTTGQTAPQQPFTATGLSFPSSSSQPSTTIASPFAQTTPSVQPSQVPARPASTPLTSLGPSSNNATSPPVAQPVKTHQTGTKNPFGPITPAAPPPVPKQPTLFELSMGLGSANDQPQLQQPLPQQQLQERPQQPNTLQSGFGAFNTGALAPGATDISSVASSFAFGGSGNKQLSNSDTPLTGGLNGQLVSVGASSSQPTGALNAQPTAASTISSTFSDSLWSSSLSTQPTGATSASSPSFAPIKPQVTGFSGLKPFKPTSSFGASLMESLPTIPDSAAGPTAGSNGTSSANGAYNSSSAFSSSSTPFVSTQMTGAIGSFGSASTLGQGLRPQLTGGGASNPFRASMAGFPNGNTASSIPPVPGLPASALSSQPFRPTLFNGNSSFNPSSTLGQNATQQQQTASTESNVDEPKMETNIESAIEHAKRAFALKKFEQAIEHYATALELMQVTTEKVGDDSPETADLYFGYGKALLENAISQSAVLGKDQGEDGHEEEVDAPVGLDGKGPILSFSGDAEEGDDDPAVDLFEQAAKNVADADKSDNEDGDEDEDAEPEDDFNAAWEVLDLARAIYDKMKDQNDDDEIRLKLADTYIALGDVSLETGLFFCSRSVLTGSYTNSEKFDQAITDYQAGLDLKKQLLPISSRQIAEAHYKLSMVLDLTSGRLSDAIVQAEKALESVEHRIAELNNGLSGQLPPLPEEEKPSAKGKGKANGTQLRLVRDELVQNMSKAQIEAELKELSELREDLALKVEELKTAPNESADKHLSAPALAAQALDKELGGEQTSNSNPALPVVNDLTSVVKKKKPVEKRKADPEAESSNMEKKPRIETSEASS